MRLMRQLVWVFLCAAPVFAIAAHLYAWRLRLRQRLVLAGHAATTLAAGCIVWTFLVRRGETVAQYATAPEAHATWRIWTFAWPVLLLLLGAAGSVHAMATLFVAAGRPSRRWLPVTIGGGALCALGLCATFVLAPDA